jgi:Na+-transporting methylmalonyl-CoA/oxaloacetate decarboxylase gamma subunit
MRMVFGVLSLLFVVAIIGFLAKKQLGAGVAPPVPAATGAPGAPALSGTPKQQVQQFKQAVEVQVQQPRAMPDDPK